MENLTNTSSTTLTSKYTPLVNFLQSNEFVCFCKSNKITQDTMDSLFEYICKKESLKAMVAFALNPSLTYESTIDKVVDYFLDNVTDDYPDYELYIYLWKALISNSFTSEEAYDLLINWGDEHKVDVNLYLNINLDSFKDFCNKDSEVDVFCNCLSNDCSTCPHYDMCEPYIN